MNILGIVFIGIGGFLFGATVASFFVFSIPPFGATQEALCAIGLAILSGFLILSGSVLLS